jgi:Tfp pilus assembly protein FimT
VNSELNALASDNRIRNAVSMIDLVITVMVMGIMAAVALPRFSDSLNSVQLEGAARRIACDINFARQTAIQSSRAAGITFRTLPAGYDMTAVTDPAHPTQSYRVDLSQVASTVVLTSANFNGGPTLSFNAYGRPLVGNASLTAGSVVLTLGSKSKSIIINSTTGEATVQ